MKMKNIFEQILPEPVIVSEEVRFLFCFGVSLLTMISTLFCGEVPLEPGIGENSGETPSELAIGSDTLSEIGWKNNEFY